MLDRAKQPASNSRQLVKIREATSFVCYISFYLTLFRRRLGLETGSTSLALRLLPRPSLRLAFDFATAQDGIVHVYFEVDGRSS